MAIMERGSFFPPELVAGLINQVQGHSSLATLSAQTPIPFNGLKEFTFNMDSEVDIVAESGPKSHGGISMGSRTVIPLKVEYGARVSDEFMISAEEEQIAVLEAFSEGFARKLARGFDLMAYHGINPRTGSDSTLIGTNHFDSLVTQTVDFDAATADANVEAAIALVHAAEKEVTGMAMSPQLRSALSAQLNGNGEKLFPELAWGAAPDTIKGLRVDVNPTVSYDEVAHAYVGDFTNGFRWGYAKQIPFEVIRYGDPDNSGQDLKGHNQVYLRAEAYIGWGILDPEAFARIVVGA